MSSSDLISFMNAAEGSPQAASGPETPMPTPQGGLAPELLNFDPLLAPSADAKAAPKGCGLPDAILAAFAAPAAAVDAAPHAAGEAEPLVGTWNFKRDLNALKEFDVQSIIEATKDGGLHISEGGASGAMQQAGEWFQANLLENGTPCGVVRIRMNESHDIIRDFRSSAEAAWEGELVGHIGFNSKEAENLLRLGVGEDAARYRAQCLKEEK